MADESPTDALAMLDRASRIDADRRLELLGVMHSAAMEQLRALADLLARAQGLADVNEPVGEGRPLDRGGLDESFLERAARRGLKLVEIERAYVHAVLHVVGGNKSAAARRLGINRRTLQRRLGGAELDEDEQDEEDENEADDDQPRVRPDHGARGNRL